jgi:hypothetical protein
VDLHTSRLYRQALKLASPGTKNDLELAHVLRRLKESDRGAFKMVVHNSGMSLRKAYYLTSISEKFEEKGVSDARLSRLGWTKLEIIRRHITKPNASKLIALAEKHKAKDLEAAILSNGSANRTQSVLLFFTRNQHRRFTNAILQFGATRSGRGLIGKEKALVAIIQKATAPPANLSKGSAARPKAS